MSAYAKEAVKAVIKCAETIERRGKSLMIIRNAQANEVGRWLQHIADEMKAACVAPESDGTPFDAEACEQRRKYEESKD